MKQWFTRRTVVEVLILTETYKSTKQLFTSQTAGEVLLLFGLCFGLISWFYYEFIDRSMLLKRSFICVCEYPKAESHILIETFPDCPIYSLHRNDKSCE